MSAQRTMAHTGLQARRLYARAVLVAAVSAASFAAGGLGSASASATVTPHFAEPVAEAVVGQTVFVVNQGAGGYLSKLTILAAHQAIFAGLLQSKNYGFSTPDAVVSDGPDLFVVSRGAPGGAGAGVSEIAATTGAMVRIVHGGNFGFSSPDAIVADGPDLFVVNGGGSISEITTSGTLVRVIRGATYKFAHPVAAVLAKGGLWVVNAAGSSLTEVNAANGRFVSRVATTPQNGLYTPDGITFDGTNLWVANSHNNTLSEFNAVTGSFVANRTNSLGYGLTNPGPMTFGGRYVYVVSPPGSSPMVTGIVPTSAQMHFWMCNTNYNFQFTNPQAIVAAGGYLFVANEGSNTVTQMNAGSGVLVGKGPIS